MRMLSPVFAGLPLTAITTLLPTGRVKSCRSFTVPCSSSVPGLVARSYTFWIVARSGLHHARRPGHCQSTSRSGCLR